MTDVQQKDTGTATSLSPYDYNTTCETKLEN